jgi:hypothetical protein
VLTPLSRYERQMERSLREAQKELETLQYARTMGCSPMYARKVRTFPSPGKNRTEEEGRYRSAPNRARMRGHRLGQRGVPGISRVRHLAQENPNVRGPGRARQPDDHLARIQCGCVGVVQIQQDVTPGSNWAAVQSLSPWNAVLVAW